MRPARPRLTVCLSIAALLLLAPVAGAQQKEELPHPKTLPELQKAMKDVVDKAHLPGAGVALVSNGELLWCGGFGKADVASGRDITCDTEFRVGSVSKSFVALALLKLQEEGKINLEARLQDVAPEVPVKNRWESTNPVRIVNLLEHTAGFDDMQASEVYNFKDPYDFSLLEVFKRFQEPQDVRWPPSTRMSYSNPGFGIAGYLIEKTAGKPFDQYIRETILRPLGMANADFPFTDANKPLLAVAYDSDPPHALPGYPYIYLRPAGDLKASPGELAKLVQFLLRRGKAGDAQILKQESIIRMESVESTLAAKNGLRLGYGLANYTSVVGGVVTHGHDGGIDGFISTYRYMPEQNWGYVVLLNSTQSFQALLDLNRLAIDFLSKDFPKSQQPAVPMSAADLEKFAGYYAPRAPRSQLLCIHGRSFRRPSHARHQWTAHALQSLRQTRSADPRRQEFLSRRKGSGSNRYFRHRQRRPNGVLQPGDGRFFLRRTHQHCLDVRSPCSVCPLRRADGHFAALCHRLGTAQSIWRNERRAAHGGTRGSASWRRSLSVRCFFASPNWYGRRGYWKAHRLDCRDFRL